MGIESPAAGVSAVGRHLGAAQTARRVTAKAVIIRSSDVLLIRYVCPGDAGHFSFPGGRIAAGESARAAVARKTYVETMAHIHVLRLLLVVEYIPERSDHRYGDEAKLQLFFHCRLRRGSRPRMPTEPEPGQAALMWAPLADLPRLNVQPDIQRPLLDAINTRSGPDPLYDRP